MVHIPANSSLASGEQAPRLSSAKKSGERIRLRAIPEPLSFPKQHPRGCRISTVYEASQMRARVLIRKTEMVHD
jgi:hypothetical protein